MAEILGFANNPTGTTPLAFAVPEGTRALVILTGTNLNFFADYDDLLVEGVPIAPLEVDVGGTPLTAVVVPTGELVDQPARAYFVANPPTDTIEIIPDPDTTSFINVWAIGGERDVEVVDARGLVSASIANPSVTMQPGGRADTVLCEIAFSGQDTVSAFAPIDGNWTQHSEIDVGAQGVGVYSRVVADGSATAAGLSQTADDALIICVAVAEVVQAVELELIGGVEAGAEASLRVMRPLALEGGAAAGAAAALLVTRTLGIDAGAATGAEAQLQVTRRLEGAAGADAGADASLQVTRRMTVEAGAEAGGQASLQITRALTVEGGAITGADASLQAVRRLQLIGGATAGLDARFASAPGELSLEGGASVGAEVTLRVGRRLAMEGGAAAGGAAELRVTRILALEAGAIAGVDVVMDASVLLSLIGGASAGAEVALRVMRRLSAEGGAIAGVTVEFMDTDWHVPPSRTFAAPGPAILLSGPGPSLTLR